MSVFFEGYPDMDAHLMDNLGLIDYFNVYQHSHMPKIVPDSDNNYVDGLAESFQIFSANL
jgi:hypothetical protein